MNTRAARLRTRAASCVDRARTAHPDRATELRDCAKLFTRQALRLELAAHANQVGTASVTLASFRAHLRDNRCTSRSGGAAIRSNTGTQKRGHDHA